MRAAMLLVLGCLTSAPAFAGIWSNLWRTPDQQGEALLEAGHPARAAARFADPRLKAYADLEADRYAQAAKLLARFKDVTSEYNRGNALTRGGHLRAALAAYDAALRQEPGDRDIRHNRNLVARMLRRPAPKPPAKGGAQGQSQQTPGGGRSQSRNPNRNHSQGQNGHPGGTGSGASHAGQPAGQLATQATPQPTSGRGSSTRSAAQARGDAALAATLARRQRHAGDHASDARPATASRSAVAGSPDTRPGPGIVGGGAYAPGPKPVSEKTLALEQWLRQIPNNPAGLLRRKFLIEYMMRHPGDKP